MKYGCCTNMLPRDPGSAGEEYLPVLSELGYDYVELPLGDPVTLLSPERRRGLKQLLSDTLPCYACNNFFPNGIRLCGPEPTPLNEVESYYRRALDIAAELGASICVLGSPWAKRCPAGWPKSEAFRQLTEICRGIGEAAEQSGITVALEPNNTLETNMINTYGDVSELVRAVDHPRIRALQDYFHMKHERVDASSMLEGGPLLVHTHFARYEGRRFPKSVDEDPGYLPYFGVLRQLGYSGGISMEGYTEGKESFRQDAKDALAFFKRMASAAAE